MSVTGHIVINGVKILHRLKTKGLEKLQFDEPTILMANHVSLLDPLLLASILPKDVCFVANTGVAEKYAEIMKMREVVTIDTQNPYSIRTIMRMVEEGKPVVIFPEGRITKTGAMMKIYDGLSYLALKTGAKIYPIGINGADRSIFSYLKGKRKQQVLPSINIEIGDPFYLSKDPGLTPDEQKQKAAGEILNQLQTVWFQSKQQKETNLFHELLRASRLNGPNTVIAEDPNGTLTYRKLIVAAYIFSDKLYRLIPKERKVGVLLPTSNANLITLNALFHLGKTPALLNFGMGEQVLSECCETANVKTVITSREFIQKGNLQPLVAGLERNQVRMIYLEDIRALVNRYDKAKGMVDYILARKNPHIDNELILFTSGSEAKPKGVVLSHDSLYANIQQALSVIDLTSNDKLLNALPMFHSFGLTVGAMLPVLSGIPTYLYPSPLHYKTIPGLAYEKAATVVMGTSTFLDAYGKHAHPYDFFNVRYVIAGGEKLKTEVAEEWKRRFNLSILEGYGVTEAAPIVSINTPLKNKKGTVGQLVPGMEYKLVEVEGIERGGSLLIKGPNLMKGYLIHGKGFVPREEWYDTGDIVEIDKDGFLSITSRLKRFAKIGGEMIALNLVEEIAEKTYHHEKLAAVNIPDKKKGERIILFTTGKDDKLTDFKQTLKEATYSPLLLPASVEYIEELPLLGSGKTDYLRLKEIAEEKNSRNFVEKVIDGVMKR